ncbi:MAG: hypothetical protein N4A41_01010 [Crocinitomicaceae bacterium]|jgi:hypothetical protein|nr:hypothetical protein [Crocinitomicaceae bacterium]
MKNIISYFFIGAMVVTTACRKENTVTGRVFNAVTDEGLQGQEVVFVRNFKFSDDEGKEFSTLTDANGNYSLSLKANKRKAHKLIFTGINDSAYFLIGKQEYGFYDRLTEHRVDLAFARYRTQNIFFVDTTYLNVSAETSLKVRFQHASINGYYLDDYVSIRTDLSTEDYHSVPLLEGWTYYHGISTRVNGTTVEFRDSIYVDGADKTVYDHYTVY